MGKKKTLNKDRKTQDVSKQEASTSPPFYAILVGIVVVITGAILIFSNLSNRYLWEDEAETALLARNILTYGIPKAFDGKNLISQELGRDYDTNYIWRWTPWLDKYITAVSFKVLGEGTLPARAPFALFGFLSLISIYLVAKRIFKDPWLGVLSTAFLSFSIPFLLYVRQCRYYSIGIFASIWALYFFFEFLENRKWAGLGFVMAMTLLFHSNYLLFMGFAFSLMVCSLICYFDPRFLWRAGVAYLLIFLLNLPWFVFFNILGKVGEAERQSPVMQNLVDYYLSINQFSFPLLALLLFGLLSVALGKRKNLREIMPVRPFVFLLLFPVVYVIFISFAPWYFFRYTISLLPIFAMLLAFMCRALWPWSRALAVLFLGCLLFTGVLHRFSPFPLVKPFYEQRLNESPNRNVAIYLPFVNYLYEITHDFDGPIEGIVKFLLENASINDRVFISYGDLPLKFYTSLEVKGGATGEDLTGWAPDWIIVRSFFRFGDRESHIKDAMKMGGFLEEFISKRRFHAVEIPYKDIWWENIPEPWFHSFRTPTIGQYVKINRTLGLK